MLDIGTEIKLICNVNSGCEDKLTIDKIYTGIVVNTFDEFVRIKCDDNIERNFLTIRLQDRFITLAEWRKQQIESIFKE